LSKEGEYNENEETDEVGLGTQVEEGIVTWLRWFHGTLSSYARMPS